jgi:hypothetical protein
MAGIDIDVHRSDRRARVGKLTRQGSPQLCWALYEAALVACRPSSPDHAEYLALKARGLSHTRASLTIARKLARRSYHVLANSDPLPSTRSPPPERTASRCAPSRPPFLDDHLPASSRSFRGSHPRVAAHQRPSGRSHSARNDRSTITSPTTTTRSRTQIGPGIHGAIPDPMHHNHSPPALTAARVQISGSAAAHSPAHLRAATDVNRDSDDAAQTIVGAIGSRLWTWTTRVTGSRSTCVSSRPADAAPPTTSAG